MAAADTYFANAFKGKHVLVSGASMGIGLSVAKGFARAGARLSILAENDAIHSAAEEIAQDSHAPDHVFECDISDPGAVAEAVGSLDHIDVLANVAGYQPMTPILDPDPMVDENFRRTMDINVNGTWYVTREAVKKMGRGGKIIFTSSIWGKTAVAEFAGYVASKHAVMGMMRSLAAELGPKGINANAVCPGWVNTEGAMWTMRIEAEEAGIPLDEHVENIASHLPIPGFMETDAMNAMYLFLGSDLANDITGQAYNVDRGSYFG
ncbi:MAG: SDR family oxidoreductase [Rhodospirillales bacterium]|nr:SDR family oxidoreductase [Rhodospirillales bacterium]